MCTVILQVDRKGEAGAKRKAKRIIGPHRRQRVYIGNLYVEHYDLVAECSTFFYQERHFAVFIIRTNGFFVDDLDYRTRRLLVFILLGGVVENTLFTVTNLQACLLVGFDLCLCLWWDEVQMCLFLSHCTVLRHVYHQAISDFHSDA